MSHELIHFLRGKLRELMNFLRITLATVWQTEDHERKWMTGPRTEKKLICRVGVRGCEHA